MFSLVAEDLLQATAEACGWESRRFWRGSRARMNGLVFRHPSSDATPRHPRRSRNARARYGAVIPPRVTARKDFEIGRANGIPVYCPVDPAGRFYEAEVPGAEGSLPDELIGKTVWEGNPIVIELLKGVGSSAMRKLDHSYPHAGAATIPRFFGRPSSGSSEWIAMTFANGAGCDQDVKWTPSWAKSACRT